MKMNWFGIINKATLYIEENITDNINLEDIAKHCNVSYFYFSKTFSMFTGYTLKEYIRNRRITLASYEVSYTKTRIIDIALKYGYSSNEAFSRAFKHIHGINPSIARKNKVTVFTHFPILNFDVPVNNVISLTYDIIENTEYNFIGRSTHIIEKDYKETESFQIGYTNSFAIENYISDIYRTEPPLYKVRYNLSKDCLIYDYLVGFNTDHKTLDGPGIINIQLSAKKAIRFTSRDIQIDQISKIKTIIYNEWNKNGYKVDGTYEIEYLKVKDNNKLDFIYIVSIK